MNETVPKVQPSLKSLVEYYDSLEQKCVWYHEHGGCDYRNQFRNDLEHLAANYDLVLKEKRDEKA